MTTRNRILLTLAKYLLPLAVIAWLVWQIDREDLRLLSERPKDWGRLALALALAFAATCLTFLRWYFLVRAVHLPFRVRDAFRLGFLGYLFNFVSMGAVGGDLFKAIFIAREQPGRRMEAVATVVVDRLLGLYALLAVTSCAILAGKIATATPAIAAICNTALLLTGIGGIGLLLVLVPGFTRGALSEFLVGLPKIGGTLQQVIRSIRMYRRHPEMMIVTLGMSMAVHVAFALSIYLIATALFTQSPTLWEHFVIVPLSMLAGAVPFLPGGLGSFEYALDELFRHVPARGPGDVVPLIVALAYRLETIGIAGIGVLVYFQCRRDVRAVMAEESPA